MIITHIMTYWQNLDSRNHYNQLISVSQGSCDVCSVSSSIVTVCQLRCTGCNQREEKRRCVCVNRGMQSVTLASTTLLLARDSFWVLFYFSFYFIIYFYLSIFFNARNNLIDKKHLKFFLYSFFNPFNLYYQQ